MERGERVACPGPRGAQVALDEQVWVTGRVGSILRVS